MEIEKSSCSKILPKLEPLPEFVKKLNCTKFFCRKKDMPNEWLLKHKGPNDRSNWIIPNVLLMSAYPFKSKEKEGRLIMRKIIDAGITVFVNLMEIEDEIIPRGFLDYSKAAKEFSSQVKEDSFISCEIPDNDVTTLEEVQECVRRIYSEIVSGKKVLVHCWGGHGRTSTVIACFLAEYYPDLSIKDIFKYVQATHDSRNNPRGQFVPQTFCQREFVEEYYREVRISEKERKYSEEEIKFQKRQVEDDEEEDWSD